MKKSKAVRDREADLEKTRLLDPERIEKEKAKKKSRALIITGLTVASLIAVLLLSYNIVRVIGKNRLKSNVVNAAPSVSEVVPVEAATAKEEAVWQEGWIKHNGIIYEYNDNIITFLIMGIDKQGDVKEVAEGTNGGQADALFLLTLNPDDKTIGVIGINRNTMTDIDIYNEEGAYVRTVNAQIAVQHGFGNGVEESCEYELKAVRKLFYNIPVHGYAAINMSAISTINDLVGGVDVTVLEDLTKFDKSLKEGAEVHLEGKSAYVYASRRDTSVFGSADKRLERQKQYLKAFIAKAKSEGKKNIGIVSDIYKAVSDEMTTDITLDEALYLAPEVIDYSFSDDNFRMMSGDTIQGDRFEEFYPDEEALYELILDVFYDEVQIE